jgi:hypothetical protein
MTIPALQLDDLTWAQMVEAIQERIPGASQGQWTLHARVDPGMTLLELYAWLLEQRLYLLDQVPDGLVRGVFTLLGLPGPAPAVPAATVLALSSSTAAAAGTVPPSAVPAGTELFRAVGAQRIVFTTEDSVALVPYTGWRLLGGDIDRTADLPTYGVQLLGSPSSSLVELVISVPDSFDPPADARLGVLLDLDVGPRIPPSWSPEAVKDVPPPAQISWSYEASPGNFRAFTPDQLDEGTGGLRRPGVVRFAWPDAWRPVPGTPPAGVTVERRLRLSASRATFSAPPRLHNLALNAVVSRHRQFVTAKDAVLKKLQQQLDNWISLPSQSLDLDAAQASPGTIAGRLLDDPATVQLALAERDGAWHTWTATGDLSTHGPTDRVFEIDRTAGRLRFGDGLNGRLPVLAPAGPRLRLSYQLGGGEEGNLGVGPWSCDTLPIQAMSAVPGRFGRTPETIEQARDHAASELARPTRAITVPDIEQIARATPGVDIARAYVAVGLHPATPCDPVAGAVTLVIVPGVVGDRSEGRPEVPAPMPDAGAIAAVKAVLEAARLIGTEIFVRGPRYRSVRLLVSLGSAVADPTRLQQRLADGLRLHLDPLAGGPHGRGWIFGEPLRPAELLGVAQRVAGRSAVIEGVSIGLDGSKPNEDCQDVAIAATDLVVLSDLTLAAPRAASSSADAASELGGLS